MKLGDNMATKPVKSTKSSRPRKKERQQNTEVEEVTEGKSPGILQKLFFWVIIPLLFVSAVLLITATATGTNVFEKVKEMTGFSSSDQKAKDVAKFNTNNEKEIADLKAQLQEKDAEIAKLQSQIEDSKTAKSKMAIEKHRLEVQIKNLQKSNNKVKASFGDLVSTYEKMTPKAAAPAIIKMNDTDALRILSNLNPEILAAILEKMPAKNAAHYTELMSKK